jgi:AraC family transcriptional activator of tynA and feaB
MRFFFSTEDIRESEQFAYWREALCQTVACLTPERDEPGPFRAWVHGRAFGGAIVAEGAAPRHRLHRTRADLARITAPDYVLLLRIATDARYIFGERELLIKEGDGLLVDSMSCRVADYVDGTRCGNIRIPYHLLRPRLAVADGPLAIHLSREDGLGRLICDYARNMIAGACAADFDAHAVASEAAIVGHLCGLLSLAIGATPDAREAARTSVAAARLDAIDAYLKANYADPTLSPASVAARFGISVRYLDKLFERTGRSFVETLLERRLSACCTMLSDRDEGNRRPIAEIARSAGFDSLTQFNRRFRAAYGLTPRAWRATRR